MTSSPFRFILGAAWAAMAVGAAAAFLVHRPIWALDAAVIALLLWAVYRLRRVLALTPVLFALVACIGIFHVAGVAGLYGMTFIGAEYDSYIHTFNSVVLGLAAFRYTSRLTGRKGEAALLAVLLTLGLGLVNELVEFVGYKAGGRGDGWFLMGAGDVGREDAYNNLMTDFLHDFLGMAAGVSAAFLGRMWRERSRGLNAGDTDGV
jgi:hypothetical protein